MIHAKIKPSDKLLARFLFPLLTHEGFLSASQREMAQLSGVSTGSVSNLCHYLGQEGLILPLRRRGRILDRKRLIKLWEDTFAEGLLPKLEVRRFRFFKAPEDETIQDALEKSQAAGLF